MIKIKVCDVAPNGACSYYRGLGVLSKLSKIRSDIQVEYIESVSWRHLIDTDILFLVRPVENNYIESINLARDFGIKVWSDYDDLFKEIPKDNPARTYFSQKNIIENFEYAVKNSDIVTVSTDTIKEGLKDLNPDIIIVENAFNDYNYRLEKQENMAKVITWRGSNTHRLDLMSCAGAMSDSARNNPDWEWVFIGCDPWYVTDNIEKSVVVPQEIELVRFNKLLKGLTPSIHIVPLVDSVFTRAKSNISWIEGTYSGACCIAPELPEFNKPGCINYKDEQGFKYLIEKAIKSRSFRLERYNQSFEYIHDNLRLSRVNQKRIQIIEENI